MFKTYLIGIFMLVFTFSYSQTTEEEYNYLSFDYPEVEENELTPKKGYHLNEVDNYMYGSIISYKFYEFIYDETGDVKAYLIRIEKFKKNKANKKRFLCIPIGSEELTRKMISKRKLLGASMQLGLDIYYSVFISNLIYKFQKT